MKFNMRKLFSFFIFFICILNCPAYAQAPNWEWAKAASGVVTEKSICVDAAGNSYVTGFFQVSATFGSITLTNTSGSGLNLYLVKYNSWGGVVWAHNAGGHSGNEGEAVAVDDSGNVYLTGYFTDTIVFGSTTFITSSSYGAAFLVKYNSAGNVIWAKQLGTGSGNGGTIPHSVAIDYSGNIFVTGYFRTPSTTFGTVILNSADNGVSEDIFLVKCDPSGNVLWAKMAGSTNGAISNSVTTDNSGNSYITGWFVSHSLTFGFSTITNNGNYNSFLARYDPNGNVVWAKGFGGGVTDYANSVSANSAGYCYVIGSMWSSSITIGTHTITNSDTTENTSDIFLIKFAPNGTAVWARSAGTVGIHDYGNAVVSDSIGNAYIAGFFGDSSITFGSSTTNTLNGYSNIYVTAYNSVGAVVWTKAVGDAAWDEATSIAVNHSGDCYITGYTTSSSLAFGSIIVNNPAAPGGEFYIAKTGEEAGIHSITTENNISIFPNPSNGNFQLEIKDEKFSSRNENAEIEIYDVLGNTVFKSVIPNSQIEIDLSANAKGIYMYRVLSSTTVIGSGKVIVQ
jgi:hypothetical protein